MLDRLFADLVAISSLDEQSSVLEIGCATGKATRSLAALGPMSARLNDRCNPREDMAALAGQRLAAFGHVEVETSSFEEWDDRGRRFDLLVAGSPWHRLNPSVG